MKTLIRTIAITTVACAAALAGPAWASSPNFCSGDGCAALTVQNNASVTVVSVKIVQKDGTVPCEKVEMKHKANLLGAATGGGEHFLFYGNPACEYKVAFNTTKGCTGDKVANLTPAKIAKGEDVAQLIGGCGTLRANTTNKTMTDD